MRLGRVIAAILLGFAAVSVAAQADDTLLSILESMGPLNGAPQRPAWKNELADRIVHRVEQRQKEESAALQRLRSSGELSPGADDILNQYEDTRIKFLQLDLVRRSQAIARLSSESRFEIERQLAQWIVAKWQALGPTPDALRERVEASRQDPESATILPLFTGPAFAKRYVHTLASIRNAIDTLEMLSLADRRPHHQALSRIARAAAAGVGVLAASTWTVGEVVMGCAGLCLAWGFHQGVAELQRLQKIRALRQHFERESEVTQLLVEIQNQLDLPGSVPARSLPAAAAFLRTRVQESLVDACVGALDLAPVAASQTE